MELVQAIQAVGFPIVAFLLMFWLTNKTIKENTNALISLKEIVETKLK